MKTLDERFEEANRGVAYADTQIAAGRQAVQKAEAHIDNWTAQRNASVGQVRLLDTMLKEAKAEELTALVWFDTLTLGDSNEPVAEAAPAV